MQDRVGARRDQLGWNAFAEVRQGPNWVDNESRSRCVRSPMHLDRVGRGNPSSTVGRRSQLAIVPIDRDMQARVAPDPESVEVECRRARQPPADTGCGEHFGMKVGSRVPPLSGPDDSARLKMPIQVGPANVIGGEFMGCGETAATSDGAKRIGLHQVRVPAVRGGYAPLPEPVEGPPTVTKSRTGGQWHPRSLRT